MALCRSFSVMPSTKLLAGSMGIVPDRVGHAIVRISGMVTRVSSLLSSMRISSSRSSGESDSGYSGSSRWIAWYMSYRFSLRNGRWPTTMQ